MMAQGDFRESCPLQFSLFGWMRPVCSKLLSLAGVRGLPDALIHFAHRARPIVTTLIHCMARNSPLKQAAAQFSRNYPHAGRMRSIPAAA
jgi:hypothetical protein